MRLLLAAAVFVLAGCATPPPPAQPLIRPAQSERAAFALNGRIAASHDGNRSSATMRWAHQPSSDEILLFASLGQTVARIRRDMRGVMNHYWPARSLGITSDSKLKGKASGVVFPRDLALVIPIHHFPLFQRINLDHIQPDQPDTSWNLLPCNRSRTKISRLSPKGFNWSSNESSTNCKREKIQVTGMSHGKRLRQKLHQALFPTNLSGFMPGNQVTLLQNGDAYFPGIEAAFDRARHEIYLQTYIYKNDATGRRIADALMRAARRGVNVSVLIDGYGSKRSGGHFRGCRPEEAHRRARGAAG